MKLRDYKKLSSSYKRGLKREYKLRYTDEFKYRIKLRYLLLAGLTFAIVSLLCAFKFDFISGIAFCAIFLVYCLYIITLIIKANKHFEKFLNNLSRKI